MTKSTATVLSFLQNDVDAMNKARKAVSRAKSEEQSRSGIRDVVADNMYTGDMSPLSGALLLTAMGDIEWSEIVRYVERFHN